MTEIDLQTKLYNIHHIVEDIKKFPQTYSTILGEHKNNGTFDQILRRKLANECKLGDVLKMAIPGTRFGKIIFYCMPKKYNILVETNRMRGSVVYVFFEYEKLNKYYIKVKEYWTLENDIWNKIEEEKVLFDGNILKWI